MIFDLSFEDDILKAKQKFLFYTENKKKIELKEKKPLRSLSQNRYLHLILAYFAWEYGETSSYVKQEIFKKQVNTEIFKTEYINPRTGEIRTAWRSSAELSTGELTIAIERFRNYAVKQAGIYLPEPSDLALIQEMEKLLSQQQAQKWV